jgi:hypothetical protein
VSSLSFRSTRHLVLVLSAFAGGIAVQAQAPKPQNLEDLVVYMQSHHKAPFDREGAVLPPGAVSRLLCSACKSWVLPKWPPWPPPLPPPPAAT